MSDTERDFFRRKETYSCIESETLIFFLLFSLALFLSKLLLAWEKFGHSLRRRRVAMPPVWRKRERFWKRPPSPTFPPPPPQKYSPKATAAIRATPSRLAFEIVAELPSSWQVLAGSIEWWRWNEISRRKSTDDPEDRALLNQDVCPSRIYAIPFLTQIPIPQTCLGIEQAKNVFGG